MIKRRNVNSLSGWSSLAGLLRAVACLAVLAVVSPVQAATFDLLSPDLIQIKGHIDPGDCERWNAAVAPTVDTVLLQSPGGNQGQGQCISRSIAERHLKTFAPVHCSSICFLMFAAGAERWTCDGARIGVHRPHNTVTGEELDPKKTEIIVRYAAGYGVPQPILDKLAGTPAKSIYLLTKEELLSMNARDAQASCAPWASRLHAAR